METSRIRQNMANISVILAHPDPGSFNHAKDTDKHDVYLSGNTSISTSNQFSYLSIYDAMNEIVVSSEGARVPGQSRGVEDHGVGRNMVRYPAQGHIAGVGGPPVGAGQG